MASSVRTVYFSSVSENTKRFAEKLGFPSERIPLHKHDEPLLVSYYYALIVPTYGAGKIKGSVPPQVRRFLSEEENRARCVGVICGGNTTFGEGAFSAGYQVAEKLRVPLLYNFEVLGTREDVAKVKAGLENNWETLVNQRVRA